MRATRDETATKLGDVYNAVSAPFVAALRQRVNDGQDIYAAIAALVSEVPADGALIISAAADLMDAMATEPPAEHDPDVRETLIVAAGEARDIRQRFGNRKRGLEEIKKFLGNLPSFLPEERWRSILPEFDAWSIAQEQIGTLEEFAALRGKPLRIVWRVLHPTQKDQLVYGTAKAASTRERDTWAGSGEAPWWEVTLSLDIWLLGYERERRRYMHHELGHCDLVTHDDGSSSPGAHPHDMEEIAVTVARWGPANREQLTIMLQGLTHEHVPALVRQWDLDLPLEALDLIRRLRDVLPQEYLGLPGPSPVLASEAYA